MGTGAGCSTEVAVGIKEESSGSSKNMCSISCTRRIAGRRCTGTEDMMTQKYTVHRMTKNSRENILT